VTASIVCEHELAALIEHDDNGRRVWTIRFLDRHGGLSKPYHVRSHAHAAYMRTVDSTESAVHQFAADTVWHTTPADYRRGYIAIPSSGLFGRTK
jgi:hypothetical protein